MNPNLQLDAQGNLIIPGYSTNTQVPSTQPTQSGGNGLLDFLLPTGGAILGGVAGGALMPFGGEIAGGAAGMAGGQALADLLEGKQPGADVALAGVGGLAGGALGGVLGKVGSGLATGVGEDLVSGGLNLTKSQVAKFAMEHPTSVTDLLTNSGLAGVNADALDSGIGKLNQMYGNLANSDVNVDPNTFLDNATTAIENLRGQAPSSAKKMADSIEQEIQDNVLPKLSQDTTMSDLQSLKKEYDTNTTSAQFNADPAQWNVNRAVGNILRKTLNDTSDLNGLTAANGQPLSKLGQTISQLTDLSDLAQKRVGLSNSSNLFGTTNEVLGGIGVSAANALGLNPLTGMLLPGMRIANSAVRSNPTLAAILSRVASSTGQGISKGVPALELAGVLGGGATTKNLSNPAVGVAQQGVNNNETQNGQIASSAGGNVPQPGSNVNSITSVDGQTQFPTSLPNPSQMANTIPGQPYSQDQQLGDIAKIDQFLRDNPGNPLANEYASQLRDQISAKKQVNDQYVSQYTQQQGLSPDQQDFIRSANPDWNAMTQLHQLLQTNGGQNLFTAFLQANPTTQTILAAQDPRYAVMFNLLGQQKLSQARLAQGGVPRAYDLMLSRLGSGQTAQANLAILDFAMKQFLTQYQQYAPLYGLSQKAATPMTGNSFLDQNILNAGG